jgi:hypothetical protein
METFHPMSSVHNSFFSDFCENGELLDFTENNILSEYQGLVFLQVLCCRGVKTVKEIAFLAHCLHQKLS